VATGAAVSVLATVAALSQPWVGRARDAERLADRTGVVLGLLVTAAGLAVPAAISHLPGLLVAAVLIGAGTGLITPLAFAVLTAASPPERLGQTMGAAEIGREPGDAGGPLLVGGLAAAATVAVGLLGLAGALVLSATAVSVARPPARRPCPPLSYYRACSTVSYGLCSRCCQPSEADDHGGPVFEHRCRGNRDHRRGPGRGSVQGLRLG
jgi:MFS family permease